jgi:ubiquinone/menaquinone biosynthesis C-methylase UbiE
MSLFDNLPWQDPISGKKLIPKVAFRDPYGNPYFGAMQIEETNTGYPIVNGILRATPELAVNNQKWLEVIGLEPPAAGGQQKECTVESFGFQWMWDAQPRTLKDLMWRAATRFKIDPMQFKGKLLLDAGCGAGDQTRFFSDHGASAVSIDLSEAINATQKKMKAQNNWVGIQGDIAAIPLEKETFDFVYCEGVIQHTKDSRKTVQEMARLVKTGGEVAATHYSLPQKWHQKIRYNITEKRRKRLSRWNPYRLLSYTGMLALLTEIPVVGNVLKKTGVVTHNPLMPDFKSTWCCTYDTFGSHSFQRHISTDIFRGYWDMFGNFEKIFCPDGESLVYLRKIA